MVKLFIIPLVLSLIIIPVYAQEAGPVIPQVQSTQNKYCSNGTCQTPNTGNVTVSKNDTNHEMFSKYPIIMIIPSELCTTALKYHLKTNCPPLQNLTKYDTSNQKISGFFYSTDGKIINRSNPQVKNHWMYYGYYNHTIICVYCTGNYLTTDLYKTIIIEPDNFEYVPKTFANVNVNIPQFNSSSKEFTNLQLQQNENIAGLTSFFNREVRGCNTATISYSDELLQDTIKYLESGCTITNFNKTKAQIVPNTPWSYNNPYSSLHYVNSLSSMFKGWHPGSNGTILSGVGLGNCIIHYCSATTSTKKPGW